MAFENACFTTPVSAWSRTLISQLFVINVSREKEAVVGSCRAGACIEPGQSVTFLGADASSSKLAQIEHVGKNISFQVEVFNRRPMPVCHPLCFVVELQPLGIFWRKVR